MNNTVIRKISVGREYPNGAIHYQVGSIQSLKGNRYEITAITLDKYVLELTGQLAYNIYIRNIPMTQDEPVSERMWKQIVGVPIVVENNIDFE